MPKQKRAPKWCYWRGDVLWCRVIINGKEIRESLRTGSVELARKRAEEIRTRNIASLRYGEEVKTWEDAVAGWAGTIGDAVGPRTAIRYEQSLRAVSSFFASQPVCDIGLRDINAMVAARLKSRVTTATVRRDLTAVSSVLDYAMDQLWREGNPARDKARRIKELHKQFVLPPVEDIEAVFEPMTGGIEDIARFAWATGMRLSEITSLDRRQVRGKLIHFRGKGGKGRTIELNDLALSIIARQPVSISTTLVFHHAGGRYSNVSSNFSRAAKKAQKMARKEERDFTLFTFHGLRHVFAIDELRSGRMGLYELSKHLGHGSVQTTEAHYLEFLTPEQSKAAKDGTIHGTRAAVQSVPKQAQAIET